MKAIIAIFTGLFLFGFSPLTESPYQDKAPVRIYLEHFRSAEMRQLSVRVLAKLDKRYRPAAGVEIALYTSRIAPANLLGTIVTAGNGIGTYTFTRDQFELAENTRVNKYFAVVNEDEQLKSKEATITIEDVNMSVRCLVKDSIKQIHVHILEIDSAGNAIPQEDVEIKFLVERPLSPLPIGDDYNTTDKEGNVSMEFPDDLPGDADGDLKILVRIVENEKYGSVEVSEIKKWGIPTFISDKTMERSLWASGANAPIILLIFINGLIAAVWGMIFYIIIKIFHIRKIGI
jgi:hypothetical protein